MTNQKRNRAVLEARKKWQQVLDGDLRARAWVLENLTTSDFPLLLGAGYQRELMAEYQQAPTSWSAFSLRTTVSDFRPKTLIDLLGGRVGLSKVAEATEYPARKFSESKHEIKVDKYGDRIPLTWEMIVNDDLSAFNRLPQTLSGAARETEDILTAKTLLSGNGQSYNTQFFRDANQNDPLTLDSLEAALVTILTRTDDNKRPVPFGQFKLVVPPALARQAEGIVNALQVKRTEGDTEIVSANTIGNQVSVEVNPWLPVVSTSKGNTRWFVLPDPNGPRPAVATVFLRGNESPDLRVKADAGVRVGGGAISPQEGAFDDDTIQYRVRHVVGAATLDNIGAYASNGS